MLPFDSPWLIPALVALWLLICGLLSWLGGWYELAQRFNRADAVDGERFYFRSGEIGPPSGPARYRYSLFAPLAPRASPCQSCSPFAFYIPRSSFPGRRSSDARE